jgi:hypothetical protein
MGYCSRRCRDVAEQEREQSEHGVDREVDKLLKQYEKQRKGK